MPDTTKDIVKSDPIETLQSASKISLQGGGVLLVVAIAASYKTNTSPKWEINDWLILVLLIGAVLLGLAGTLARLYDAKLRVQLTLALLEKKGTTDAKKAEEMPSIEDVVLDMADSPIVFYAVAPSATREAPRTP